MTNNLDAISVIEASRRLACANLKRCPLCDALNAANNEECFVCRWHGRFDRDPKRIDESLARLLSRCPEFRSWSEKLRNAPRVSRRLFRKSLDFSA